MFGAFISISIKVPTARHRWHFNNRARVKNRIGAPWARARRRAEIQGSEGSLNVGCLLFRDQKSTLFPREPGNRVDSYVRSLGALALATSGQLVEADYIVFGEVFDLSLIHI